uniref:Uncharacterized protein n=1 Tax=Cacopsylla melanoneura TaxID=428564 RepID=A0A8D8VQK3_9HEMI
MFGYSPCSNDSFVSVEMMSDSWMLCSLSMLVGRSYVVVPRLGVILLIMCLISLLVVDLIDILLVCCWLLGFVMVCCSGMFFILSSTFSMKKLLNISASSLWSSVVLSFVFIVMSSLSFVLPVISLKQSHIAFDLCLFSVLYIFSSMCFCFRSPILFLYCFFRSLYSVLLSSELLCLIVWWSSFSLFPSSIISGVSHSFCFSLWVMVFCVIGYDE